MSDRLQPLLLKLATAADVKELAQMNQGLIKDEQSSNTMSLDELEQRMLRRIEHEGFKAYFFELEGEQLGYCLTKLSEPNTLWVQQFYVDRGQRRRGIGSRAVQLLRELLPADGTLEIDVLNTNPTGAAFWKQVGFMPYSTRLKMRATPSEEIVTLFRPMGEQELDLVRQSGFRAWPPRLEFQPIFYPVLTLEYARLIARTWNVEDRDSNFVGYVTKFDVRKEFIERYPIQVAGGSDLQEYWIPAADLAELNMNIVGQIQIIEEYRPASSGGVSGSDLCVNQSDS